MALVFLIPAFNEWEACSLLLRRIDQVLRERGWSADVVLIDDGSTTLRGDSLKVDDLPSLPRIEVLELARNLGHQRAIAVGLAWLHEQRSGRTIILIDGDGEDNPEDVPRLIDAARARPDRLVTFAARTRRAERWTFRLFYRLFQALHWLLTGYPVRVGNFSLITPPAVARLTAMSETWSHYAAAVFTSRIPYGKVPSARLKRLVGESRMNFTSLIVHGLSALSVFSHIIGVRLLVTTSALCAAAAGAFALLVLWSLAAPGAVPAWAPWAGGILLLLALQQVAFALLFTLLVLSHRQAAASIPARDYHFFLARVVALKGTSCPPPPTPAPS
jgi:hypothetical protein